MWNVRNVGCRGSDGLWVAGGYTIILNILLTRSLALLVFFGFGLLSRSERNEQNPLGNFWVYSISAFVLKLGLVRILWIWFVCV